MGDNPKIEKMEEKPKKKISIKFKFNYVYAKRIFIVACVIMCFILAYLFALNNRYYIDNDYAFDKWREGCFEIQFRK